MFCYCHLCEFSLFSRRKRDRVIPQCHSRIRFRVKLNLPVILPLSPLLRCMCSFPQFKRQFCLHGNQFGCRTSQTWAGQLQLLTVLYSRSMSQVKMPLFFPSLNRFHVTAVSACIQMGRSPDKETSAQDCSCCQKVSM